jgi:RNA polymerase sigma factor (sigma-70 family)
VLQPFEPLGGHVYNNRYIKPSQDVLMSELELIEACIQHDRKAQKMLYEQYNRKLFVVSMRYARSRADAEDILQDSFVKIFQNLDKFRNDCPLDGWLRRIVANTALKFYSRKMHQTPIDDIENHYETVSDTEFTISQYNFKELLGLIQQLPLRCQMVFNLYAIEGYQHNEIAEMLEISEGTSKSQYARAKQTLQKMLTGKQSAVTKEEYV